MHPLPFPGSSPYHSPRTSFQCEPVPRHGDRGRASPHRRADFAVGQRRELAWAPPQPGRCVPAGVSGHQSYCLRHGPCSTASSLGARDTARCRPVAPASAQDSVGSKSGPEEAASPAGGDDNIYTVKARWHLCRQVRRSRNSRPGRVGSAIWSRTMSPTDKAGLHAPGVTG